MSNIWDNVPQQYQGMMITAGQKWNVDPSILAAIGWNESRYDPAVISGQRVSSAGAIGIMQFEPGTAQHYKVNPTDPQSSIDGAAHYLHDLLAANGGNMTDALNSYSGHAAGYAQLVQAQAAGSTPPTDATLTSATQPAFSLNPVDWVGQIFKPLIEFLIEAGMVIGGGLCMLYGGYLLWKEAF